jgi:hypothetical protein
MLVVQLEDLQGSVEVVVFPKVYADTVNAWTDDSVVLVSGRVDHRDEEAKLLVDTVHAWDDAKRLGPAAYSAERDRMSRSRGRPYAAPVGAANGLGTGEPPSFGPTPVPDVPLVRPRGAEPVASPAVPEAAPEAADPVPPAPVPPAEEAPAPADARPIPAVAEGVAGSLWISFAADLTNEALLDAIESVTSIVKQRPGALPVVLAVPVAGATRQVRLPQATGWDEGIEAVLRREVAAELSVERRPEPAAPSLSSGA